MTRNGKRNRGGAPGRLRIALRRVTTYGLQPDKRLAPWPFRLGGITGRPPGTPSFEMR